MTDDQRLSQQIRFLIEIDRLKEVFRRTWLIDQSRRENDAEHSWHLALYAMLLREYAGDADLDLLHVLKLVLVHDLVEIDAGDTYAYDEAAAADQAQRERRAADRIFRLLPADQAGEFRDLWDEFTARRSGEARYAAAMDHLQPFLHNYYTGGKAWREHGVTSEKVIARTALIAEGSPALWQHVQEMIRDAVETGYLAR